MKTCPSCGNMLKTKTGTFYFDPPPNIPGGTMNIPNSTWKECESCGECMLPYALNRAIEELSMKRQGLLLPVDIKAIRDKAGLTTSQMAARLGVEEKTYLRWETGRSIQGKDMDDAIRKVL